jgi:hypothetical protein
MRTSLPHGTTAMVRFTLAHMPHVSVVGFAADASAVAAHLIGLDMGRSARRIIED